MKRWQWVLLVGIGGLTGSLLYWLWREGRKREINRRLWRESEREQS